VGITISPAPTRTDYELGTLTFDDLFAQAFGVDDKGGRSHPYPYQGVLAVSFHESRRAQRARNNM
jgi:hypothetical protein